MLESQIAQLTAAIPSTEKGKIPGQSEEIETVNLVEIYNADFYKEASSRGWQMNPCLRKEVILDDLSFQSRLDLMILNKLFATLVQVSMLCQR